MKLSINGHMVEVEVAEDTPLLWVIRDHVGLKGTKFGCGIARCGVCTVHLNGVPTRSCVLPVGAVSGREITTIEGLGGEALHPLQQAWIDLSVPQCGYCQCGQLMSAAALLEVIDQPTDEEIDAAMSGNLCRCATYPRIRAAIRLVAARRAGGTD